MSRKIKITILCVFFGVLAVLPGCSDSQNNNPVSAQYLGPPIVTGMIITDETGIVGVWGDPTSSFAGFPNPSCGCMAIVVSFPNAGAFRVWVVKAYGPGESYDPLVPYAGGEVYAPYGAPLRTFTGENPTGMIGIAWDGADDAGNPLPSGFYRIYVTMGNRTRWGDVFLARDCADIPDYLNAPKCDE